MKYFSSLQNKSLNCQVAADRSPPPPPPQLSEPRVGFQPRRGQATPVANQREESLPCYRGQPRTQPMGERKRAKGRGRGGPGVVEACSRFDKSHSSLELAPKLLKLWAKLCSPGSRVLRRRQQSPPPPSPPTTYPRSPPPPLQTSTLLVIFFSCWRLLTMQKSHVTSLLLSLLCAGLTGKFK